MALIVLVALCSRFAQLGFGCMMFELANLVIRKLVLFS